MTRLSKNLAFLRKQRHITQADVAKLIGVSRASYANYESAKSEPVASVMQRISTYYDIRIDDLLTHELSVPILNKLYLAKLRNDEIRILVDIKGDVTGSLIPFVAEGDGYNYACNYEDVDFVGKLPSFVHPNLSEGIYRAFEVFDNSMPPFSKNDVLICKYVSGVSDLVNGKRYLLIIRDLGVLYRRVYNSEKGISRNVHKVILVADSDSAAPTTVSLDMILEAWVMEKFISSSYKLQDIIASLASRLERIESHVYAQRA